MVIALLGILFGLALTILCAMAGGWGWAWSLLGIALIVLGVMVLEKETAASPYEADLRRIEHDVRRASREIDRLEAEAFQAMSYEAMRQRLGNSR